MHASCHRSRQAAWLGSLAQPQWRRGGGPPSALAPPKQIQQHSSPLQPASSPELPSLLPWLLVQPMVLASGDRKALDGLAEK